MAHGTSELEIDPDSESYDSLDEVLSLFRANTFFRNFEIKGPADRLLIYGILFLSEALGKIKPTMGRKEAEKVRLSTQSERKRCDVQATHLDIEGSVVERQLFRHC